MTRTRLSAVTVWPDVRSFADQWYSDSLYSCVLKSSQHNCDFRFQFYCPIHCLNPTEAVRGRWECENCFLVIKKKQKNNWLQLKWRCFHVKRARKHKAQVFFFLWRIIFSSSCGDKDISSLGYTRGKTSSVFFLCETMKTNVSVFTVFFLWLRKKNP